MANNENNRKPILQTNFFDGMVPTNNDFLDEQAGLKRRISDLVSDFHGSGVLPSNQVALPPILSTSHPSPTNISFSILGGSKYDGKGIFVDRQPIDTIFGDQLTIEVKDVDIQLYNPLKVIIFGRIYDPNLSQGKPILETLVFNKIGEATTFNYFKTIIAVFFNNFSGGTGRTELSSTPSISINSSALGKKGSIIIREVGPLKVLNNGLIVSQAVVPNIDVRDFITSTITRTFKDELVAVVNTSQNTNYVSTSLDDVNQLNLNLLGLPSKPFLDSTTNGVIYGQKIFIPTNNIQQISFVLSLESGSSWSGELVLGIRPLQTKSTNQFANKVDLDPDLNILFEASFTQSDLLDNGFILSTVPQEIKFNFIGTALAKPNGIITENQFYIITITRRADVSVGKIFIDIGNKILANSKFSTFNPSTKAWVDDSQTDLWFKVYSSAIRISSGVAYTIDGNEVSIQKTLTEPDGTEVSAIAGPFSLAVIDSVASDNIVILSPTQKFTMPSEHPRTGNLVFLRVFDQATIDVMTTSEFVSLVSSTANINTSNFPIVLAVINDFNNKTNPIFNGVINFVGQVRKDQIVLFNTGLSDDLLNINNVIIPNISTLGIKYRIVDATTTNFLLGDFNNDHIFTSSDLVQQAVIQDTFSAQSTNTFTGTSFDPYSVLDARSRDALGFGKETIENFVLADVESNLIIDFADTSRLQYLTTTLPALVSPAPTTTAIQILRVENLTAQNNPILVTQITNIDGYANAVAPNKLFFTALSVGEMRAMSIGDIVDLSADGYTNVDGQFTNPTFSGLLIEKFIQRNDLLIETRFQSNVLPSIDTSYILTFYDQNPVFDNKLGITGEVATEVLEFVAPGIDLMAAGIILGDIVQITNDTFGSPRNGSYSVSQIINPTTFRVFSPSLPIVAGVGNAGLEFFASDGITDKLVDTDVIQFTVNSINLLTSNIQQGDIVHITLGPISLNGIYTVARVLNSTVFTIFPPAVTAQTFNATFEFRAAGDVVVKIPPTAIIGAEVGDGPTPHIVTGLESLAPAFLPDGIDTIFNFSLTHVPITGNASVHWVSGGINKTMVFMSAPVEITGDGNTNNSSINRITGEIILDTFQPPDANTDITIDYRIAPVVTLKHCYPTVVNAVSLTQTDIEFRVPFINSNPNIDIQGIAASSFVLIQTNNADPPNMILDGFGNVIAGKVQTNSINSLSSITLPSRNIELQLTDGYGNVPNITSGSYWAQIYSGTRINLPAIQKEFLSDALSLSSPISWRIQKNNFEWSATNLKITDFRRFLPTSFVSKSVEQKYSTSNSIWTPADLFVGKGDILGSDGLPHHGDLEITAIMLELPITALLSNSINIYNNLIASYLPTPGFTRAGRKAMVFSDGTFVGADDVGTDTALTRNQVCILPPTLSSLYLDGYKVPNASIYTDLDEVLTKLHFEIRSGLFLDANGILYFHIEGIKAIFDNEPILQTGVVRIGINVALKKKGFANQIETIGAADIGRLFTNPVEIIPITKYSISGEIVSGFTVGKTSSNPDG